jgi:NDP-sugar pyrophosphorylase family protein
MKALILSAGFGTRLRPITDKLPKPLIPVLNVPVIEYNIHFLKHFGITDIYINLHHLPEKMKEHLGDGSRFGVKLSYLFEKEILGTGGSIAGMKEHSAERFLVMNADTIFDFDLEKMLDFHASKKALVTLGLIHAKEGAEHAVVAAAGDGRLIRMLDGSPFGARPSANAIFSGIHIIEPGLFDYLPAGIFYSITTEVYQRLVRERADILGYFIEGCWFDTGTPGSLIDCSFDLLSGLPLSYPVPQLLKAHGLTTDQLVLLGKKTKLPAVPVLPPVIIGDGAKLSGMNTVGPWLVVGDGAKVSGGTAVQNAIYLPGAQGDLVIRTERGQLYY